MPNVKGESNLCSVCSEPTNTHLKCDGCGVLVGIDHYQTELEPSHLDPGHQVCSACNYIAKKYYTSWDDFLWPDKKPNGYKGSNAE